jgi:hypothetical protein
MGEKNHSNSKGQGSFLNTKMALHQRQLFLSCQTLGICTGNHNLA